VQGHAGPAREVLRTYTLEVEPTQPGSYLLYLPIPMAPGGAPPAGFALRALEGAPRYGLVQTEHGPALRLAGEGKAKLEGAGPLPWKLTLDDPSFAYRQFKFFAYLGRDAAAPVLVKVAVEERTVEKGWEKHSDLGKTIAVQQVLEPVGWQVVKGAQIFDVSAQRGYEAGFPKVALGSLVAGLGALYVPLGMVVAQAWRRREA
jgi:hypothetical protein